MRTVDEPGVARHLARRQEGRVRGAAGRHRRHLHRRPRRRSEVTNLTKDDFADSGADLVARRQVDRLPRARQRQREAVPRSTSPPGRRRSSRSARTTTAAAQFLDADTLVFPSTATDPDAADRSRRRAQRQHLQHLDAQPEERRAAAVHRRGRRQHSRRRAARTATSRPQIGVRQLLQGRVRAAHARPRATRSSPRRRPTSARRARSSTSRRRCRTRWSPTTSGRRARSRRCSSTAGRR